MSNDLEIFNDILHLYLRPWKVIYLEQKFRELLHSLAKENYHHQPLYEVAFPKPLTGKTRYYRALIDNEAAGFLNNMEALITSASVTNEKKYHLHQALSKKLKDKLEGTEKVIVTHQFYFKTIEDHQQNKKVRDDAWIIEYVKYQLIRLYLEIQDRFPEYLTDDPITEEDILSLYFTENISGKCFIIKVQTPTLLKSGNKIPNAEEIKFTPVKGDVSEPGNNILKYSQIIADPGKFARFEVQLFDEGLINIEYNFIKNQGNVQKLAAVYQVLIKKKYFNEFYSPVKNKITDRQIKDFLNYRYNTNIDKEFRRFGHIENGPPLLEAYLTKNPWLTLIPSS